MEKMKKVMKFINMALAAWSIYIVVSSPPVESWVVRSNPAGISQSINSVYICTYVGTYIIKGSKIFIQS
jgi:hypothetical protein